MSLRSCLIIGMCLVVTACSPAERLTVDDLHDESFDSLIEVLRFVGCDLMAVEEGLIARPPLAESFVIEMAQRSPTGWDFGYGPVTQVTLVGDTIWLFEAEGGEVVGGIDENLYTTAFCAAQESTRYG